ncbi:MAG: penicillin-binding transpeptidase domain-containing protein, partial [Arenicellales bacterium]
LGSATVTPMEIVRGYAVFANGGYLIEPYFIARIEDQSGGIIEYANRVMLCPDCPAPSNDPQARPQKTIDLRFAKRIISAENAFIVDSLMQEVVRSGTARAAAKLDRDDLAGKTGTTNNYFDAWFTGYNPDVVTSVWVGFDSPKDLGEGESGARAALPIWIDFMSTALGSSTKTPRPIPDNIISVRVNRDSGLRAREDDPKSYLEYFVRGSEPPFPDPGSTIDPIQGLF